MRSGPSTKTGEAESARETCFVWKTFCKYSGSFLLLVVFLKHRLYMAVVSRSMHITGVSFGLRLAAWPLGGQASKSTRCKDCCEAKARCGAGCETTDFWMCN